MRLAVVAVIALGLALGSAMPGAHANGRIHTRSRSTRSGAAAKKSSGCCGVGDRVGTLWALVVALLITRRRRRRTR